MIYVIKKGDYIYITLEKRNLDSEHYQESELLLTLDWPDKDKSILEDCLRPYLDLNSPEIRFKDRPEVINIIQSHPLKSIKQYYIYKIDIEKIVNDVSNNINCLIDFGILDKNTSITLTIEELVGKVLYRCDVYNLISDNLGIRDFSIIESFGSLGDNEKELIINFYKKTSKTDRLDFLKNIITVNIDKVLPFIPKWYKTSLRLFGLSTPTSIDNFKFSIKPEYIDNERLDENSTVLENSEYFIRKEVYQVFKLNEVWKGKDIKSKFGEIYEKLGTPKSSRVHDIFKYFDTAITRSGYKLISRKIV